MSKYQHKTVSANSRGIIVSFHDTKKHKFVSYSDYVQNVQVYGRQPYNTPVFNRVQQNLYGEVVYGLNVYTNAQIQQMPEHQKRAIIRRYTIAQRVINKFKQRVFQNLVDKFFMDLFPRSPFVKAFAEVDSYDPKVIDRHTFKELGITQKDVADKLLEKGLLPKDFYQLT